jgi:hypothetical protein
MVAFIDDYRAADGVEPICAVLPIAVDVLHGQGAGGRSRSAPAAGAA